MIFFCFGSTSLTTYPGNRVKPPRKFCLHSCATVLPKNPSYVFPFLLGQQVYIPDTSPTASRSQAHEEKWSVPLDENGSTGAGIRTQDLRCAVRTP